ncbi:MAG: OmpA family protein [Acidobacteriota bacterium]|nr:OmpA family protein [Acidobacteriota bacterium]
MGRSGRNSGRKWWFVVTGWLALTALVTVGCASSKRVKVDEFPQTVEAVVEATPSEPDRIDFLDVEPWTLEPGQSATVTLEATAERRAEVVLKGLDGAAAGRSVVVEMKAAGEGRYTGRVTAGENLPPGKYRIEASLLGGPTGEPTRLVSSRALTVAAPPPPVDPCVELAGSLATPVIHFDFDKYDLDDQARAYIRKLAASLKEIAPRVAGLTVEGHCDERGTVEYNLALGARRALAVRDALLAEPGMDGLAVSTLSRGEEQPLVPGARTEQEHARNRRAVLVLECSPRN